jgi:MFS family permease
LAIDVICPTCNTMSRLDELERDASGFCQTCDYPLFWANRATTVAVISGRAGEVGLRRLPGTEGRATVEQIACPVCVEPNLIVNFFCVRCGSELRPRQPAPTILDLAAPPEIEVEPPPPRPERFRAISTHQRLGVAAVIIGVLMAALSTTVLTLALFQTASSLHIALGSMIWVMIGYLLVMTVLAIQGGRLGDMFGRARMFQTGTVIFLVSSALCALAWDQTSILAFLGLQGVGGALIAANSGAIIADIFPPDRRHRGYGFGTVGWGIGAVLGILIGAALVTYLSWPWAFWVDVPLAAIAAALAFMVLKDVGQRPEDGLDLIGIVTLGLGLFGLLGGITRLATASLSTTTTGLHVSTFSPDAVTIGLLAGGVAMLVALVVVERRADEPMLDLSLLRAPAVTPTLLASLLQCLGTFVVAFMVIMFLRGARGLTPVHASLLLVPELVVGSAIAPLAGWIVQKAGPVIPATVGIAAQIAAVFVYSRLSLSTGLWVVVAASALSGIGAGAFWPANGAAFLRAIKPEAFGVASGCLRTAFNVGLVLSFSAAILAGSRWISRGLAFAILTDGARLHGRAAVSFTTGLRSAFYASMVVMGVAGALSATKKARQRSFSPPAGPADQT